MPASNELSPNYVIEVNNLVKKFGEFTAVKSLNFNIKKGSTTALLGGNGAGKTTTISMLLGLLLPSSGSIKIMGSDMLTSRYEVLERMNFSSPYADLPRGLTAFENFNIYGRLYNVKDLKARIEELVEILELGNFLNKKLGTLSAGQQTRVSMAKSLINKPDVLLLDEPTASLDPDTADKIREYLDKYQKLNETTIVLASHNMKEVERMCDNVLMMKQGEIVNSGSPKELIKHYGREDMEEVFLDIARGTRKAV